MKINFNCDTIINWTFIAQTKIEDQLKEIPKNTEHLEDDERMKLMYERKNLEQDLDLIKYHGVLLVNCVRPDSNLFEFDTNEDIGFLSIITNF